VPRPGRSGLDASELEIRCVGAEAPEPIGGQARRHPLGARRIVAHQRPFRPARKAHKGILQRLERPVTLEMVGFDVVDDRDAWMQREKGLVILVGFDDVELVPADPRVPTPGVHPSTGDTGYREPRRRDGFRRHRGRRGFAVGPGDGDAARITDQPRQRLLAGNHRDPLGSRRDHLDVLGWNRGAHHHSSRVVHVLCGVTRDDFRAGAL